MVDTEMTLEVQVSLDTESLAEQLRELADEIDGAGSDGGDSEDEQTYVFAPYVTPEGQMLVRCGFARASPDVYCDSVQGSYAPTETESARTLKRRFNTYEIIDDDIETVIEEADDDA
jgi:hypothetical protein